MDPICGYTGIKLQTTLTSLRVLHVASGDRWGGAEAQIFTLLCQLKKRTNLQVRAVLLNEAELAERLREKNIAVDVLDENKLSGWGIFVGLRRLMVGWQPHIIHTHRSKENILASFANILSVNTPSLRTSHGAPEHVHRGIRQIHKKLHSYMDEYCGRNLQTRIVAVSKDLGTKLAKLFPIEKIVVIENGLDVAAAQSAVVPVEFRVKNPDGIHIGLIGRLDPVKRIDIFLKMAALLLQTGGGIPWKFHIFGDGQLLHDLIAQAEALEIQQAITFHGHRSDIVACAAGLDAIVICSDHEGLPMTLLESMAVGTPVIAHAVGGMCDVLKEYKSGILVDEHQPEAYASAVLQVIEHGTDAVRRLSAKEHFPRRYSAAENANQVLALYTSLIESAA